METSSGKLSDFTPDQQNANKGTEYGGHLLEKSLRQYGAGRSVLADKHGNLIAGNKTAEKAAEIGMDDVIIVHTDGTKLVVVQRDDLDLDSKEGRELALLDNKVSQVNLDFDIDVVGSLALDYDIDVESLGFSDKDNKKAKKGGSNDESNSEPEKPKDADTPITFGLTPQQTAQLFKALETARIENDITNAQGVANELSLMVIVDEFLVRRS
ncbi:ParB N-terminal domain-containing protein [Spirosoma litoris]